MPSRTRRHCVGQALQTVSILCTRVLLTPGCPAVICARNYQVFPGLQGSTWGIFEARMLNSHWAVAVRGCGSTCLSSFSLRTCSGSPVQCIAHLPAADSGFVPPGSSPAKRSWPRSQRQCLWTVRCGFLQRCCQEGHVRPVH